VIRLTKCTSEASFNESIFQCIDQALSTLGETTKLALYHQAVLEYGLQPGELRSRPFDLLKYLQKILGRAGYGLVEKLVIHEIMTRFNLGLNSSNSLSEAISEARTKPLT
jgi:hypothetical protein